METSGNNNSGENDDEESTWKEKYEQLLKEHKELKEDNLQQKETSNSVQEALAAVIINRGFIIEDLKVAKSVIDQKNHLILTKNEEIVKSQKKYDELYAQYVRLRTLRTNTGLNASASSNQQTAIIANLKDDMEDLQKQIDELKEAITKN